MDVVLDFFYICLLFQCFIYYSGGTSSDEYEEVTNKKRRNWTPEEEQNLIYFDVLTDTGKPNHFNRIKNMWRQEYPESNVTDIALRRKVQRLRMSSQEEGEMRKQCKWNEKLERELLDIYMETRPYKRNASITIDIEWNRRHPEYKPSRTCLVMRAGQVLRANKYPEYKSHGRLRHSWTRKEKAAILHFLNLTDTGEPKRFDRVKLMWRERFPDSNLTDTALLIMYQKLRRESRKEGERKKYLHWTPEEEKMLLDIYLNTHPFKEDANITFAEAWKQRERGPAIKEASINQKAKTLLKRNKYPEYTARAMLMTKLRYDKRHGPRFPGFRIFKSEGNGDQSLKELKEGSQAESSKSGGQKRNKEQQKMKSLNELSRRQEEGEPKKGRGKAPMVYSSDESASPSPPTISEESE